MNSGIKRLRQDRGISQGELAKRANISQAKLSYLEKGLPASPEEIQRIAKALDLEGIHGRENG